jgi:meiotic recombination protein REC8
LPTSSPVLVGEFRLEGDDGAGSVGGPSVMLGAGDTVEIEDPGFMFGDDGEIIQFSPRRALARTPAKITGVIMSGDVGANVRAQKEPEKRRQVANQVSFAAFFHIILHCDISC